MDEQKLMNTLETGNYITISEFIYDEAKYCAENDDLNRYKQLWDICWNFYFRLKSGRTVDAWMPPRLFITIVYLSTLGGLIACCRDISCLELYCRASRVTNKEIIRSYIHEWTHRLFAGKDPYLSPYQRQDLITLSLELIVYI